MRRVPTSLALAALLVLMSASAAFGHASFREREVPADSEQTLVMRVPEERPGESTVAVETLVPPGFDVVDCPSDDSWACEVEEEDEGVVLSWSRASGTGDAMLTVVVRTPPEPGDHRWPTIQTYDSGTEAAWTQDAGEDRPAPVLTVTDAGAPVVEDTSDPADHGTDDATGEPVAPGETVPPTEPTATEFTPPVSPSEEGANADPTATTTPSPDASADDGGPSIIALLVVLALAAAAIGALRNVRATRDGRD